MIVRAADSEEYSEIYDLVNKAFNKSALEYSIIKVTTGEDSNFRKGDLRIVEIGGKIVSMVLLIRRPLRIGTAIVNGCIVSPVATHPECQRKGYCSAVMRDAIQYMKTQDLDMTILWGVPWLYPHYEYSPAMVNTELVIKPEETSPVKDLCHSYESRSFIEDDLQEITRIYHNNTTTRICAEIRFPTMWEWRSIGADAKLQVLKDEKNEVVGYYSLGTDWGRPCAHEIGVLNDDVCKAVFNSLLEIGKERGLKEFYCIIHPDHPFARFAFWHDGEIRLRRGGGAGMVRVLNLASILKKMKKELEHRLQCSELHNSDCALRISSEESSTTLTINQEQISIEPSKKGDYELSIPLASLNPLISGYKSIIELIDDQHVKINGGTKAIRLIEVLFPKDYPFGGYLPLFWE